MSETIRTLQFGMGWFPEQAGGLNRVYYHLMKELPGAGVSVRGLVAGTPTDGAAARHGVDFFAPIATPLPVRWFRARHAAREALSHGDVDLVASHFALYTFPALGPVTTRPLVVHFHGPWALESAVEQDAGWYVRFKLAVENAVYGKARLFIVLSEAFASVLRERYGVPAERIRVVPGGADVTRFGIDEPKEAARERLGWPSDRFVVLAVRRLAHRMGLENLIDAMATVRRVAPEVMLYVAGKGPLAGALEARIAERGLEDHVRLLGFVPDEDLPAAYRAADLTIVPTQSFEGFGLITVESLASGTPVLVTPVGGLPEVVRGLSPDLVLAGSNAAALAEGLTGAVSGARRLPDAGACRAYTLENYTWASVARRTRDVYREALR